MSSMGQLDFDSRINAHIKEALFWMKFKAAFVSLCYLLTFDFVAICLL